MNNKYDNIIMSEEVTAVWVLSSHIINGLIGMLLMDEIVENVSEENFVFLDVTINQGNLEKKA